MRKILGVGTPRGLAGRVAAVWASLIGVLILLGRALDLRTRLRQIRAELNLGEVLTSRTVPRTTFSTGC